MISYDVIIVKGLSQAGTIALKNLGQHRKCGAMHNEQMLSPHSMRSPVASEFYTPSLAFIVSLGPASLSILP